jgi:hypothetical protein
VFSVGGFERDRVAVMNDVLPGMALLRVGLLWAFVREKLTGPAVRRPFRVAPQSQRKGAPRVDTLRAIVVVQK